MKKSRKKGGYRSKMKKKGGSKIFVRGGICI